MGANLAVAVVSGIWGRGSEPLSLRTLRDESKKVLVSVSAGAIQSSKVRALGRVRSLDAIT